MKTFWIVLVMFLFLSGPSWANRPSLLRHPPIFNNGVMISVGVSAGQETFIGLPKFGIYKQWPIHYTKCKGPRLGFRQPAFYAGAEGSLFILFAGVFSAGPNVGFGFGPVSIDNSLTFTAYYSPESDPSEKYWSWNPKLGVNIGPVWLKSGPCIYLKSRPSSYDWLRLGQVNLNVELLYLIR